jgi:ATP-dependent RNA helicase DDX52/ROK1
MAADRYELFKRLCVGAQFDRKQLRRDNALVQGKPVDTAEKERNCKDLSELDFFGDSSPSSRSEDSARKRPLPVTDETSIGKRSKSCNEDIPAASHPKQNDHTITGCTSTHGEQSDGDEERTLEEHYGTEDYSSEVGVIEEDDDNDTTGEDSEGETAGGVSLFKGQSIVPSKKEQKKHKQKKKKQSSKKKLANMEIELHKQKMNALRNAHQIHVSGSDVPDPVDTFEQLVEMYELPQYIVTNIEAAGYTSPTPIQMQAMPLLLQNREILACAPTGSGKTAAYIIPILKHLKSPKKVGFRALVLAPTRELAQQIYREFVRLSSGSGFKVHVLTKANASSNTFGPQSSMKFDILVATPNRLIHMLQQQPPTISLSNVEWLILDEADKLFEEGTNSFREQIAEVYTACSSLDVRHALFSATMGSGVEEFTKVHFESPVRVLVGLQNAATDTVEQELLFVGQEAGKLIAMRDIVRKGFAPPVLVFVQSIDRAKELFHELIYDGINVEVIHAERTQAQRDNIVKAFRAGKIWVLICTDLMGRGIDFKGVNTVVNYDFPTSAVAYIHRIGRTGRAGRTGKAVTFFTEDDATTLKRYLLTCICTACTIL